MKMALPIIAMCVLVASCAPTSSPSPAGRTARRQAAPARPAKPVSENVMNAKRAQRQVRRGGRAFEGVRNVWVSNDRWANSRTHVTFATDAVRLAGAENGTDEEKAIAVYRWGLRVYGHGGAASEGPKGKERSLFDVWNHVHAYPKGLCDKWGRLLVELWIAYKGDWTPASKWGRKVNTRTIVYTTGQHSQSGLYWVDADGVGRYHLMDAHLGFYTFSRDGAHIASPEDIDKDITLLTAPSRRPTPYFIRCDTPPGKANPLLIHPKFKQVFGDPPDFKFDYNRTIPLSAYTTDFDLRKGESLRRQWFDDGKFVIPAAAEARYGRRYWFDGLKHTYADGTPKDPYNYKYQVAYLKRGRRGYGNGYHVYRPALRDGAYVRGAQSASGLAAGNTRAGHAAVHPAAAGAAGELVYRSYSIYPYAESFIEGEYVLAGPGRIDLDFSIDGGKTWHLAWSADEPAAGKRTFKVDIGRGRWDKDEPSTFNMAGSSWKKRRFFGYRYHVRFRMKAADKVQAVGLNRLAIRNTVMLNFGMLPTLVPGRNTITLAGADLSPGCAVKVVYAWREDGRQRTLTAYARKLPHRFTIDVRQKDPAKVRCRYFDVSVIDAAKVP